MKKLLSLVLSVVIVMSLFPTNFAIASDSLDEAITYDGIVKSNDTVNMRIKIERNDNGKIITTDYSDDYMENEQDLIFQKQLSCAKKGEKITPLCNNNGEILEISTETGGADTESTLAYEYNMNAELYAVYYDQLKKMVDTYGEYNSTNLMGVGYASLVDFDVDGTMELLVAYGENTGSYPRLYYEVYGYKNNSIYQYAKEDSCDSIQLMYNMSLSGNAINNFVITYDDSLYDSVTYMGTIQNGKWYRYEFYQGVSEDGSDIFKINNQIVSKEEYERQLSSMNCLHTGKTKPVYSSFAAPQMLDYLKRMSLENGIISYVMTLAGGYTVMLDEELEINYAVKQGEEYVHDDLDIKWEIESKDSNNAVKVISDKDNAYTRVLTIKGINEGECELVAKVDGAELGRTKIEVLGNLADTINDETIIRAKYLVNTVSASIIKIIIAFMECLLMKRI